MASGPLPPHGACLLGSLNLTRLFLIGEVVPTSRETALTSKRPRLKARRYRYCRHVDPGAAQSDNWSIRDAGATPHDRRRVFRQEDRPASPHRARRTAVMVVDMLNEFCKPGGAMVLPGYEELVPPAAQAIEAARQAGCSDRLHRRHPSQNVRADRECSSARRTASRAAGVRGDRRSRSAPGRHLRRQAPLLGVLQHRSRLTLRICASTPWSCAASLPTSACAPPCTMHFSSATRSSCRRTAWPPPGRASRPHRCTTSPRISASCADSE